MEREREKSEREGARGREREAGSEREGARDADTWQSAVTWCSHVCCTFLCGTSDEACGTSE
jgi:hypothetical protein